MWFPLKTAVAGNVRQNVKRAASRLGIFVRKQLKQVQGWSEKPTSATTATDKPQGDFNKKFDALRKEIERLRMLHSRFVLRDGNKLKKLLEEVAKRDVIKRVVAGFKKYGPSVIREGVKWAVSTELLEHIEKVLPDDFESPVVEAIVKAIIGASVESIAEAIFSDAILSGISIKTVSILFFDPTCSAVIVVVPVFFTAKLALKVIVQRHRSKCVDDSTSSEDEESAMTSESSLSVTTSSMIAIEEMVKAYE